MKREIKFRAWNKGEMVTDVQPMFFNDKPICMIPDQGMIIHEPNTSKRFWHEIEVESIMQYTGLKDKNGVEIYEDDIIIVDNENYKVFQEFGCWIYDHFIGTGDFHLSYFHDISINFTDYHHDCEVIGNIHANPELLK